MLDTEKQQSIIDENQPFQDALTSENDSLKLALEQAGIDAHVCAPSTDDLTHIISAPFAISLVFVMYSFSGWNAATYIIGEMRTPQQSLPRALLAGTLIVLVLYVALNAVFLHTAPIDKLAGQLDVARISGSYIFGEFGGRSIGFGPTMVLSLGYDILCRSRCRRRSARPATTRRSRGR